MKTPMQDLIEQLKEQVQFITDDDCAQDKFYRTGLLNAIKNAEWLLDKEKEVIMDAHIEGQRVFDKFPHTQWTNDQAEQYYSETFNTKEK